jgi:hypothetical protein
MWIHVLTKFRIRVHGPISNPDPNSQHRLQDFKTVSVNISLAQWLRYYYRNDLVLPSGSEFSGAKSGSGLRKNLKTT